MTQPGFQIGEISRRTGASIRTIRFYEAEGLLPPTSRRPSGYRLYTEQDVEKLRFIQQAKRLGLALKEIRKIMRCSQDGLEPCCALVRQLFTYKIGELEHKIAEFVAIRNRLKVRLSTWVAPAAARRRRYTVCPQIESVKPVPTIRRVKR